MQENTDAKYRTVHQEIIALYVSQGITYRLLGSRRIYDVYGINDFKKDYPESKVNILY